MAARQEPATHRNGVLRLAVSLLIAVGVVVPATATQAAATPPTQVPCQSQPPGNGITWDCSYADLHGQDLHGLDLQGANFYLADLSGVDLSGANLTGALFVDGNLANADLRGADLSGARVGRIDLTGTQLTGTTITDDTDLGESVVYDSSGIDLGALSPEHRLLPFEFPEPGQYDASYVLTAQTPRGLLLTDAITYTGDPLFELFGPPVDIAACQDVWRQNAPVANDISYLAVGTHEIACVYGPHAGIRVRIVVLPMPGLSARVGNLPFKPLTGSMGRMIFGISALADTTSTVAFSAPTTGPAITFSPATQTRHGTAGFVDYTVGDVPGHISFTTTVNGDPATTVTSEIYSQCAACVSLSIDTPSSVWGQPVSIAAVTPYGKSGKVSFYDGASLLATKAVDVIDNETILTTSTLSLGSHDITAQYRATTTATPIISAAVTVDVDRASSRIALSSPSAPTVTGEPITFDARVYSNDPSVAIPSGPVQLYDGVNLLGTKNLVNGNAKFSVKPPTAGSHPLTALYVGTLNVTASSTAAPFIATVNAAPTTTSLTTSANPAVNGQFVTLKATVKVAPPGVGKPTGVVNLYDNGSFHGSTLLVNGVGKFAVRPGIVTHDYTATYAGSADYLVSTTPDPLVQSGVGANTKVTLMSQHPTTTFGHVGAIVAKVTVVAPGKGVPTGVVTFTVGVVPTSVYLVNGVATLPLASLDRGTYPVTAFYSGGPEFNAGLAPLVLVQVIT